MGRNADHMEHGCRQCHCKDHMHSWCSANHLQSMETMHHDNLDFVYMDISLVWYDTKDWNGLDSTRLSRDAAGILTARVMRYALQPISASLQLTSLVPDRTSCSCCIPNALAPTQLPRRCARALHPARDSPAAGSGCGLAACPAQRPAGQRCSEASVHLHATLIDL